MSNYTTRIFSSDILEWITLVLTFKIQNYIFKKHLLNLSDHLLTVLLTVTTENELNCPSQRSVSLYFDHECSVVYQERSVIVFIVSQCIFLSIETDIFTTDILMCFNSFMTEVPIIQKPVNVFVEQINGMVSI